MSDTKLLQTILDKVSAVQVDIKRLDKKIDGVEERLTKRIDAIGMRLAYLEDDAPTRDEFDHLEKRVTRVEKKLSSVN